MGEPRAKDTSQEATVLEQADVSAPGCHPHPEEQTDSLSPARRDTLTELGLPGESCTTAPGTTATAGRSLDGLCMEEGVSGKPARCPDLCRHTGRVIAASFFTASSGL